MGTHKGMTLFKKIREQNVVAHAYNPSTSEAKAGVLRAV
jgi:hypothetical protein